VVWGGWQLHQRGTWFVCLQHNRVRLVSAATPHIFILLLLLLLLLLLCRQVFGCGHYYCDDCAQQALSAPKPTCPYCRKAITRRNVFR
jgi:hypothetical protein